MKFNNHKRRKGKTAKGLGGLEAVSKITKRANYKTSSALNDTPSPSDFKQLQQGYESLRLRLFPLSGSTLYLTSPVTGMHRVLKNIQEATHLLKRLGGRHG